MSACTIYKSHNTRLTLLQSEVLKHIRGFIMGSPLGGQQSLFPGCAGHHYQHNRVIAGALCKMLMHIVLRSCVKLLLKCFDKSTPLDWSFNTGTVPQGLAISLLS